MKDENTGNRFFLQFVVGLITFWISSDWLLAICLGIFSGIFMPKKMVKVKLEEEKSQTPPQETDTTKKRTYSKEELKRVYYNLSKKYHPDLAQSKIDKEFRNRLFGKINDAYQKGDMDTLKMYEI